MKINITRNDLIDYLQVFAATCMYAVAVAFFLLPYKLTTGGVAGIGALIYYVTGFEVQNSYLLINAILLIFAVKELGWKFCFRTIFAVLSLTFTLWLWQRVYELVGSPMIVGDQLSMACLIGAILEGVALALCFLAGGSTGGTDIIAAIVNKYRNMSLGTLIMLMDVVVISSCYFVFYDIQRVIFGFVLLIVSSISLDYFISRNRQAVEFKIFSRNPKAIAEAIIKTGRGVTLLEGQGYYTKSERKVILSVVRKREQMYWLKMIKSIDPFAFVTMTNVNSVWGEGFDVMKVREKSNALKRKVIVLASDEMDEIEEMRTIFGAKYDVRSLMDVGCDVSNPINTDILSKNAVLKARFVKQFYGYDCVAYGTTLNDSSTNIFAVATGNVPDEEPKVDKFANIEEVKGFFETR